MLVMLQNVYFFTSKVSKISSALCVLHVCQ